MIYKAYQLCLRKIDFFIFEAYKYSNESLAVSRVLFCFCYLFFMSKDISWVLSYPDAYYNPPLFSIGMMFSSFPDAWVIYTAMLIRGISLLCILFGYRLRIASVIFAIMFVFCETINFSLGKIDHNSHAVFFGILIMGFSNWGNSYAISKPKNKKNRAYALSFLAMTIALMFLSAGLPKIGWVDFNLNTRGVYMWLFSHFVVNGDVLFRNVVMGIQSPYFWEALDIGGVVFECGFIFALFSRGLFQFWCVLALLFHVFNFFVIGIDFSPMLPVYLIFFDWDHLLNRMRKIKIFFKFKLNILKNRYKYFIISIVCFVFIFGLTQMGVFPEVLFLFSHYNETLIQDLGSAELVKRNYYKTTGIFTVFAIIAMTQLIYIVKDLLKKIRFHKFRYTILTKR